MIKLENVTKEYIQKNNVVQAVKETTLEIKKGEIYGIIGYSGAGKSTLVRLFNLLEVPTSGKVIFDGKSLTDLSAKDLREERKKIGMIFQHFNLLSSRTVGENVAFSLEIAKWEKSKIKARVQELLEVVELSDKIDYYPSQLSGGQKQRVSIARAVLKNPPIMILDEATSSIDTYSEELIQRATETITKGRTSIVIAHRLATIINADKIVVMEKGIIVEQGTHSDLVVRQNGYYKRLYDSQFAVEKIG